MMRFLAILSALFIASGSALAEPSDAQDAIRAVLDAQTKAWNVGNIRTFMEGYHRSGALRFVSGNSVRQGFDETLERYAKTYNSRAKMGQLAFTDLDVDVISDDAAIVFGRFHLTRPEVGDATGLFTLIFRKIDGQWLIVHDHTSS